MKGPHSRRVVSRLQTFLYRTTILERKAFSSITWIGCNYKLGAVQDIDVECYNLQCIDKHAHIAFFRQPTHNKTVYATSHDSSRVDKHYEYTKESYCNED